MLPSHTQYRYCAAVPEVVVVPWKLCVTTAVHVGWLAEPKGESCTADNTPLSGLRNSPETVLLRKLEV